MFSKFAAKLVVAGASGRFGYVAYDTIEAAEKARKAMDCNRNVVDGKWPVARPALLPGSYIQGSYGWNPYQAPMNPLASPGPIYGMPQLSSSTPAYSGPYLSMPSPPGFNQKDHAFPERPGQPECQHHIETGKYPTSVYYVHPSDANTSQLVSVKFNGTGYSNWKRSIMLSLSAKNKLGFIDGSISQPVLTSPDYKLWERCNDLVCSWLLCNVDETISKNILFFKTTREIWLDLEDRFGYASMTQVFSLEQQLSEFHQGSKSVSEFFTEIKAVWDAISDVNHLPCYTLRGNILMQQPLPSLSNAFRIFSQEERHQELSHLTTQTESLAFVADNRNKVSSDGSFSRNSRPGFNSSSRSWSGKGAAQTNSKRGSTYFCTHCNISGHSNERCFKLHGYPPNFKFRDKKVAAISVNNAGDQSLSSQSGAEGSPQFSVSQYTQILELLNKQNQPPSPDHSKHALLAGKDPLQKGPPILLGELHGGLYSTSGAVIDIKKRFTYCQRRSQHMAS
ncbi:hypothetical protein AgCh_018370 [Apium graveolens]